MKPLDIPARARLLVRDILRLVRPDRCNVGEMERLVREALEQVPREGEIKGLLRAAQDLKKCLPPRGLLVGKRADRYWIGWADALRSEIEWCRSEAKKLREALVEARKEKR